MEKATSKSPKKKSAVKQNGGNNLDKNEVATTTTTTIPSRWPYGGKWECIVVLLTAIFMHIYYGIEFSFGQFLVPYSVKSNLKLDTKVGADITSAFWGVFCIWRLITVIYINYIGLVWAIVLNLILMLIGNCFLVPFGNKYEWALWLSTIIIGAGISPIWGCIFGYLREYIQMSSRVASTIIIMTLLGEFVFPAVLAKFISCHPDSFSVIIVVCSVAITALFALIHTLCITKLKKKPSLEAESNS